MIIRTYIIAGILTIEPLIEGLRCIHLHSLPLRNIEPLIGGLIRPCGNEQLVMRN